MIEDSCGTAEFAGQLTESAVKFDKWYLPGQSIKDAVGGTIHYKGMRRDKMAALGEHLHFKAAISHLLCIK